MGRGSSKRPEAQLAVVLRLRKCAAERFAAMQCNATKEMSGLVGEGIV